MFQPDEPNGIRNAVILWVVLFVIIYIFLSIHGCTTVPAEPSLGCPKPTVIGATEDNVEEVFEHIKYAMEGCIRHYGPNACLTKLVRKGYRDYAATCKVIDPGHIDYSL